MMDWERVLKELEAFRAGVFPLKQLGILTIDTLYGSMYGLNHRYMTLGECLRRDFVNMLHYSLRRIHDILQMPPVSFRPRPIPKVRLMGFGTYGWKYDHQLIRTAVQKDMLIDTAEGYGYGKVEQELGKALAGSERGKDVTTKVSRSHMSYAAMSNAAWRSRKKLGIVPHYQLHFPNALYSDETLGKALVALRRMGVIQSIGLGNCSVDMIESMQGFLSDYSGDVIRTVQVRYNLLDRRIEKTLLPYCQERGIAIIAYSPLGQRFSQLRRPVLDQIGKRSGCSAAQVALAWILRKRGVIPIPRTNDMKHLEADADAVNIELDESSIEEIEQVYPYGLL